MLQSMGFQTVRHDLATEHKYFLFTEILIEIFVVYFIIVTEITLFYLVTIALKIISLRTVSKEGCVQTILGLIPWLCDLSLILSLNQFPHFSDNYFLG